MATRRCVEATISGRPGPDTEDVGRHVQSWLANSRARSARSRAIRSRWTSLSAISSPVGLWVVHRRHLPKERGRLQRLSHHHPDHV